MKTLRFVVLVFCMLTAAAGVMAQTPSYDQLLRDVRTTYDGKDYPRMLATLTQLDRLRPNHPWILVNLASAYSLTGRPADAITVMNRLAAMKILFDVSDHDFDAIRGNDDFKAIEKQMQSLRSERIAGADVVFRIPRKGLITEGLAFDPKSDSFFVSSVRKGRIIRIDSRGRSKDLTKAGSSEVHGLSGLALDAKRRVLWACSTASPRVEGFKKGDPNDASLVAFDLRSGDLVQRVRPADAEFFCDDLTIAPDGTLYVSDSTGSISRVRPGGVTMETLVPRGKIRSPQGSVLSADGKTLYVADYGGPIRAVDVASGDVAPLQFPPDFQVMGIDGLTRWGGSLIAVQNGIAPNRVVRLDLAPGGLSVQKATILEMNHPLINEPTIGQVVGNYYYFVGTSEGNKFDRGDPDTAKLSDGLIFRIRLR